jgi:Tol biopolymer transport system component
MPVRSFLGRACAAVALALALAPVWAQAATRPITDTDLFRFVWVADPQISPDGRRVAFVRVTVSDKKDGYDSAVWVVDADGTRPARALTTGTQDLSPRWSPDGRRLAFTRAVEKAGKLQPAQIYVLSMDGGEPRAVTEIAKGASGPVWSPDGSGLAFTSSANAADLEKAGRRPAASAPEGSEERESDVRVITRAAYRSNGRGFLDTGRPGHIWTIAADEGTARARPQPVTSGEFDETSPAFSPDGRTIFFVSNRVKEPYYDTPDSDL